ncbi:MAG: sialidase family protein, partial [Acidobacteriota bacterium]
NGVLYLAWSQSTSPFFGDRAAGSNVLFVRSDDGGATWTPAVGANPVVASDVHHVLPSLAIDNDPNDVHVGFYTQHDDGSVDVDLANSHNLGNSFPTDRTVRVTSTNFVLPPTVIRLTAAPSPTTNYDRLIVSGYSLGEYLSVKSGNGAVYALWGDCRNNVTEPINALDPISGQTHSQQDVFFQAVKAQ